MRKYIRKQPDDIRFMFNLIAHRYNLMNSLITFGYDKYWRRTLLNQTRLPNNGRVLDIGTGTGAVSYTHLRAHETRGQVVFRLLG